MKTGDVLRRQGFRGHSKIRPEIKSILLELLATVENAHLLEPAVAYEYYQVTEMSTSQMSLEGDKAIHGSLLPKIFPEAKELASSSAPSAPSWKNRRQTTAKAARLCAG